MPVPSESPRPSEPVVASTPGIAMQGWPCSRLPILRRRWNSSFGKKPLSPSAAYRTGAACPLERTSRSREGDFGEAVS